MKYLLLIIPIFAIILSIMLSVKIFNKGQKAKKAFLLQILSFLFICISCITVTATIVSANTQEPSDTNVVETSQSNANDINKGLGMLAAALATGLAGIGGGIAVAAGAPAAIAATAEDPKSFGKSMVFVALGEGIALYGVLIAVMIILRF